MDTAKVNDTALLLLRRSLFQTAEPLPDLSEEAWKAVWEELRAQRVHVLIEPLLAELPVSGALRQAWTLDMMQMQARWHQVLAAQSALLELLERARIPVVVIKGAAAARYYPQPSLRCAGDVDVLVKPSDFDRAAALMEENGCLLRYDTDEKGQHHKEYEKDGVCLELHRWLGRMSGKETDLLADLSDGIDRRTRARAEEYDFPILPEAVNGYVLLSHIHQHLREGIGLRQILDWAMFVHRNREPALWERELLPLLRRQGFEVFGKTVTAMCVRSFGLPADGLSWCEQTDPELCDRLLAYLLKNGNFGWKTGDDGHDAFYFSHVKGPADFFSRLHAGGLKRWRAARKHRILRPFAWIVQLGHIVLDLLRKKRTPKRLKKLRQIGMTQRRLIEDLGLEP